MRTLAREVVFKYLFSTFFNQENSEDLFLSLVKEEKLTKEDAQFASSLKNAIESHFEELTQNIDNFSKGYKIERIFTADKCALYIGMAEIVYFDDIPNSVAIDEAVKLAKKFSAERSVDFVNGVLGAFNREIK